MVSRGDFFYSWSFDFFFTKQSDVAGPADLLRLLAVFAWLEPQTFRECDIYFFARTTRAVLKICREIQGGGSWKLQKQMK